MKLADIVELDEGAQEIVGGIFKDFQSLITKHLRGAKLDRVFKQKTGTKTSEIRGSGVLPKDSDAAKLKASVKRLGDDLEEVVFTDFARKTETTGRTSVVFAGPKFDFSVVIQPL